MDKNVIIIFVVCRLFALMKKVECSNLQSLFGQNWKTHLYCRNLVACAKSSFHVVRLFYTSVHLYNNNINSTLTETDPRVYHNGMRLRFNINADFCDFNKTKFIYYQALLWFIPLNIVILQSDHCSKNCYIISHICVIWQLNKLQSKIRKKKITLEVLI